MLVLNAKARGKSVDVRLDAPPDVPPVNGFGGELNQVWVNLIDNAIDAVDKAGHIKVVVRHDDGWVTVGVVDDGCGIASDHLPRVFNPFFTTKPVGQGTGLGLDISRRIVQRHGDIAGFPDGTVEDVIDVLAAATMASVPFAFLFGLLRSRLSRADAVSELVARLGEVDRRQGMTKQEPLPPTFKNSIGMEFVLVPKGKSWLGGGKDKLGDKEVEIPADFYLGKYEVTQEEWEKVMGENPSHFSRTGDGKDAVKDIPDADLKRFPVENVSWDNARCSWRS